MNQEEEHTNHLEIKKNENIGQIRRKKNIDEFSTRKGKDQENETPNGRRKIITKIVQNTSSQDDSYVLSTESK